jgi:Matrixin/Carboxypeptidase regulatory-like domain
MKLRMALIAFVVLLLALPLRAYVTARSLSNTGSIVQERWSPQAFPLQWQMNPIQGPNVTGTAGQEDVFKASFAAWQALTTASISFAEGTPIVKAPGYDEINLITTNLSASEYGSSALGLTMTYFFDQGGVVDEFNRPIDFAGQILEADIFFNPEVQFSTSATTPPDKIDLQSVATHEVGHLLGLDHSSILSATMFPFMTNGTTYARVLSTDDIAGVSTIYPTASFASKGTLTGTVRTTANATVYGAIVTAVNTSGQPVASAVTDPQGKYTIVGLDPGAYTVYAEPLDQPITVNDVFTYSINQIYGTLEVFINFTTRFR